MRANDVAIGIAIAWARFFCDEDVVYNGDDHHRRIYLLVWSQDRGAWDTVSVDRGLVVEQRLWIRVPTSGIEMLAFGDALIRATEARAQSIREAGARARRRSSCS